jgi:hypothetical protein
MVDFNPIDDGIRPSEAQRDATAEVVNPNHGLI